MDRRDFLKVVAGAGMSAALGGIHLSNARAATSPYIVVQLLGAGAWDTSMLCNPLPNLNTNNYANAAVNYISPPSSFNITQVGAFSVAPTSPTLISFMKKYSSRLMWINGLDGNSNNHFTGQSFAKTGLLPDGYPSLGALHSAINAPQLATGFASAGPSPTASITSLTPILDPTSIVSLVQGPTDIDLQNPNEYPRLQSQMQARQQRLQAKNNLPPRYADQMSRFAFLRDNAGSLDALPNAYADLLANVPNWTDPNEAAQNPNTHYANNVVGAARVGMAYVSAGMTVAFDTYSDLFDTHSQHDITHPTAIRQYFETFDFLIRAGDYLGISDRLIIVGASDFGRTPTYNGGGGKDHWPISGALVMVPGVGNRVIGATDDGLNALSVNQKTLAPDDSGVHMYTSHLQLALRRFIGVADSDLASQFPLAVEELDFFGA